MSKDLSILDEDLNDITTNGDNFGKDSIVLARLNRLPAKYTTDIINNNDDFISEDDCSIRMQYLIKSEKEVFDSMYNSGKELFKLFQTKPFIKMHEFFEDTETIKKVIKIFNNYVYENGFPFYIGRIPYIHSVLDDEPSIPNALYIVNEFVLIYGIEELRKWIFKFKQQLPVDENKTEVDSFPTNGFETIYNYFIDYFISMINLSSDDFVSSPIIGNVTRDKLFELLNKGLPSKKDIKLSKTEIDYYITFLETLQGALIYVVLQEFNSIDQPIQYSVSKRLPIYNKKSKNYRLYTMAYSLFGIAFDYLLLNLTATRRSYKRIICEVPDCNNEFEKISKSNLCPYHQELNFNRSIANHKYYLKNQDKLKKARREKYKKEKNETKKEATEK